MEAGAGEGPDTVHAVISGPLLKWRSEATGGPTHRKTRERKTSPLEREDVSVCLFHFTWVISHPVKIRRTADFCVAVSFAGNTVTKRILRFPRCERSVTGMPSPAMTFS